VCQGLAIAVSETTQWGDNAEEIGVSRTFHGRGVSPGTAIGPARVLHTASVSAAGFRGVDEEIRDLDAAVAESMSQLQGLAARLRSDGHEAEAGIMDAQVLMASDPSFLESVRESITAGSPASAAVQEAAVRIGALFEGLDDPYLAARQADVRDVADRLSRNLRGDTVTSLDRPSIVVAADLTPSQTLTAAASLASPRMVGARPRTPRSWREHSTYPQWSHLGISLSRSWTERSWPWMETQGSSSDSLTLMNARSFSSGPAW
jgi:signal transduction protein with GAF and PtsI domain